jgi:CRISPR-associated protein Csy2
MRESPDGFILLPHLRVQNANAISGPLSWGFPPPSAFTGFVHALHRKFGTADRRFDGAGIVCHRFEPQIYRPGGNRYVPYKFCLARHPIGKDGKTPGITEEGRVHLEVSLLIGVYGYQEQAEGQSMAESLYEAAQGMRLAGGSVLPANRNSIPQFLELSGVDEDDSATFRRLRRRLLPGFALVSRHDLLLEHYRLLKQARPDVDLIETLLDLTRLNIDPASTRATEDEKVEWSVNRRYPGWLVPLPVGYGSITPLYQPGEVANTRDSDTPFRFVESLYSLGEWRGPHRLENLKQMLWHHRAVPDDGLYLIEQEYTTTKGE